MIVKKIFLAFAAAILVLPCTAQAQTAEGTPLSAQLWTVRDVGNLDQQFGVIEQAGYRYVEMYRFYGMPEVPLQELKTLLDKHHLKISGYHVAVSELADNLKHTIEYNKSIGNTRLIVPAFPAPLVPSDKAGWQALGKVMQGVAEAAKPDGMKIGFHNHTAEMKVFEGKTGLEWFAEAAPDVIITVDCAWAYQGGQDPAALIRRLKGHVWNIHVKDDAPLGTSKETQGLATVGKGVLKWDDILKAAHEAGVQWFTVENDRPVPTPLASLTESREYIAPRLSKELGK